MSTQATLASKEIKKELKKAFPKIKFSVRSDTFSGGNAVRISWIDGPLPRKVNEIVGKFQYGHFDGMTDSYEYSNRNDNIPQVKYVQTSRSISDDTKNQILADFERVYGRKFEENGYDAEFGEWVGTLIYQRFNRSGRYSVDCWNEGF